MGEGSIPGMTEKKDTLSITKQDFLDIAGVMFVVLDTSGNVRQINKKGCEILGYKEDEILGKDWFSHFLPKESRDEVRSVFIKLIKGDLKPPEFYTNPVVTKHNGQRYLSFHNGILRDREGNIVGTLSSGEDITERKKAEEALRNSEQKYRNFFKTARDCVFITSRDGKWLDMNDAAVELFGYESKEELRKVRIYDLYVRPEERDIHLKKIERIGYEKENPIDLKKKDGTIIHTLITSVPIRDERGEVRAYQGSIRDITKQKNTEEALKESEAHYRALFDRSRDFVFIHDFEGNFIEANKAALDIFGYSKEEIRILNFRSLLADDKQNSEVERALKELAETGRQKELTEFKLKKKNGEIIWVETKSSVIYRDGKPAAVQGIGRDVTKRKKAEQQLERSLHEKEVLLQEIHHRVKNNMQIIISLLRLQSRDVQDRRDLELFRMSQERIYSMALIHEKLYRSKDFTRVNFAQYFESFIIHILHTYNVDSNRIRYNLDVREVRADINKAIPLGLIFNELVSNVFKHAFPDGRRGEVLIKLRRHKKNKKITLTIRDNGVGMPDELDLENPKTLGLQLVKDLVEQINGDIRITKKAGTEIEIIF